MNKKFAIGCGVGCLGILLIGGIAAYIFVPKILEWGQNQLAAEGDRQEIANAWIPPKDAIEENFFPKSTGGYELQSQDDQAAVPDLQIDLEGWHAQYKSNSSEIDVFVYQLAPLEKEAIFGRINEVYENHENGSKAKTNMGYRMYYSSSEHGQNHLWWTKGWLFVFRTKDSEDREPFVKEFLTASSGKKEKAEKKVNEKKGDENGQKMNAEKEKPDKENQEKENPEKASDH